MNLKTKKEIKEQMALPRLANCRVSSLDALQLLSGQRYFTMLPKRAFSIAEAMIVFLVVSIVLGMSAPMISKQIKYNNFSDAQISVLNRNFEKLKTDIDSGYNAFTSSIEDMLSSLRSLIESNTTKINNLDSKVNKLLPVGSIIMWSGSSIPENWALCNGQNGTPDLRDRFVVSTGSMYAVGDVGGLNNVVLSKEQMPQHSHTKGTMRIQGVVKSTDSNGGEFLTFIDSATSSGALKLTDNASKPGGGNAGNISGLGGIFDSLTFDTNLGGWTGATSEEGSGKAHENRPPYYALAFIMKVK